MTHASWTDEQLSAFVDGELSAAETDTLARDLESDPQLAARAERLGAAHVAFIVSSA
jgi:anti-sigma factor RsiW